MFCGNCGKEIKETEKFCSNCGVKNAEFKEEEKKEEESKEIVNNEVENNISENVNVSDIEPNKKKGNTALLVIIIVFIGLLVVGLSIFLLFRLFYGGKEIQNTVNSNNQNTVSSSTNSSNTSSGNVVSSNDDKNNNSSNSSSGSTDEDDDPYVKYDSKSNTTVVGNSKYGYLKVPGRYTKFYDVDGNSTLQFSNALYIITMYSYDSSYKAKNYADNLYKLATNDSTQTNVTMVETSVNGYKGYKVESYYTNEKIYLDCFVFDTPDNLVRYISIEGPTNTADVYKSVNTFSLSKIN